MIDLSHYEGLHVLRASATIDGKPSWCLIVVNADGNDNEYPNMVAWERGQFSWSDDFGKCHRKDIEITSIIGELVLPASLEPPCCDPLSPPVTCTISSDCSDSTIDKLIKAMTMQHSILAGLVEKLAGVR